MNPPGPIAVAAARSALANVGVREDGRTNSGRFVNQYHKAAGSSPGDPWCLAFVVFRLWVAAGRPKGYLLPRGFPRSAYTPDVANWAKKQGVWIPAWDRSCAVGDLALFYRESLGRIGHVGMVVETTDDGWVSVEGNSNDDGSREGYEVARLTRTWGSLGEFGGFARLNF